MEVSTLKNKRIFTVWCVLIIVSCQVPPAAIKDKKGPDSPANKIDMPKKRVKKNEISNNQKPLSPMVKQPSKKSSKTNKTTVQEKSVHISHKMIPLPNNGIKVIIKEIEEPVGRNQSQAQVEAFVLQKAKRLAVEEAGTYISSLQVVKQGKMTEEQVNALASGILQTEIVGDPQFRTENSVIFIKVKARIQVDTSVLVRQVEDLKKDKTMMEKLLKQQALIKELESQISGLKQSDIKSLEILNSQALAIEKQRAEQRHFLEQQRLAARKAIQDAQLKQIKREKILNQELQKILKAQEAARKQEKEAIAREQDRIKRTRLENEAALQELARKAQIQQASWQPFGQIISAKRALEEARKLRKEIANVVQSLDGQYQNNLSHLKTAFEKQIQFTNPNLPSTPVPREIFETTKEYQRRMAKHYEKVQNAKKNHAMKIDIIRKDQAFYETQLKKEWLTQKKKILAPFIRRLETLQSKKFTVPDIQVTIEIEKPEADRFRFPMIIMCQGIRYHRYWKYSDRKAARNLWKTREYFQGVAIQQLTDSHNYINFKMIGCQVTHHGITEKQFYYFQKQWSNQNKSISSRPIKVEVFQEIVRWHNLETKIQRVSKLINKYVKETQ